MQSFRLALVHELTPAFTLAVISGVTGVHDQSARFFERKLLSLASLAFPAGSIVACNKERRLFTEDTMPTHSNQTSVSTTLTWPRPSMLIVADPIARSLHERS